MGRIALLELHLANVLLSSALLFSRWIDAPVPFVIASRCVVAAAALWIFLRLSASRSPMGWEGKQSKLPSAERMQSERLVLEGIQPGSLPLAGLSKRATGSKEMIFLALSGVLLGGHWIVFFYAGRISSIALAVVTMHTYPLMTSLIEPWLEGSVDFRKYRTDVLLALVAFLGIAYMGSATLQRDGLFLGLMAAVLITARNLVVRRRLSAVSGARSMLWQIVSAGILLSPALFYYSYRGYWPQTSDLVLILTLGLLITAVAHTLLTRAVVKMSARTTGIIASVQPLYSAVAAYFFFDEIPSSAVFLGGGLVLGSAMLESYRYSKRTAE